MYVRRLAGCIKSLSTNGLCMCVCVLCVCVCMSVCISKHVCALVFPFGGSLAPLGKVEGFCSSALNPPVRRNTIQTFW